jgi:hypothetical protein
MEGSKVFISSCSRRQLARRRPGRHGGALRMQVVIMVVALALAVGAFLVANGGI